MPKTRVAHTSFRHQIVSFIGLNATAMGLSATVLTGSLIHHTSAAPVPAPPLIAQQPKTVPGGAGHFDIMEVDQARHRLLVAHSSQSSLGVFDLGTGALIREIKTGGANGVAVAAAEGKYYVGAGEANLVAVINSKTLTKITDIKVTGPADAVGYNPRSHEVYAGHDDGEDVWVINSKTDKIISTVKIPAAPEFVAYDPTSNRMYQNIKSNATVVLINPATHKITARWSTVPALLPHGLAIDFKLRRLYVAGGNGKLVALEMATGKVMGQADIAPRVDQIAFDPGNKRIYCASGTGVLSVVEATAHGLRNLGNVPTGKGCHSVTVDPGAHAVWVAYGGPDHGYLMKLVPSHK